MWRRVVVSGAAVLAMTATPALAQDSVFGINVGGLFLQGEDGRSRNDVLVNNLGFLSFDIADFTGVTIGGDYFISVGAFVEVGVGLNLYQRTVPSVYARFVDIDGSEIEQDLRLRVIPVTATARFFPLSRDVGVQPYIGGGVAFNRWRYSETGEFVDFSDGSIFRDNFVDQGTRTGPVFLGGLRFPIGASALIGGEYRYTRATVDLDPALGFAGETLELGGNTLLLTLQFKF
jgi:opacity protein-like surface antigen